MKKYYKNNQLVVRPKVLFHDGKTHLNPTDELLEQLGYRIEEVELKTQQKELPLINIEKLNEKFKSLFGRNENKNN
jgi:hypothetical protein